MRLTLIQANDEPNLVVVIVFHTKLSLFAATSQNKTKKIIILERTTERSQRFFDLRGLAQNIFLDAFFLTLLCLVASERRTPKSIHYLQSGIEWYSSRTQRSSHIKAKFVVFERILIACRHHFYQFCSFNEIQEFRHERNILQYLQSESIWN